MYLLYYTYLHTEIVHKIVKYFNFFIKIKCVSYLKSMEKYKVHNAYNLYMHK